MTWLNTKNDSDAGKASVEFWKGLSDDLKNESFWADKIKQYREQPTKRLKIAIDNLPLPGAFIEAAVSVRGLIREKRKNKDDYKEELALLYWLAAINSFSIPYSNYLKQPGYNVIESIPGSVIKTLPFSYFELGYNNLKLLNKTDIKWCIETWGEPNSHTSLHELHKVVWQKYEKDLKIKQQRQLDKLLSES